jgi:hypothetical protein
MLDVSGDVIATIPYGDGLLTIIAFSYYDCRIHTL